MLQLVDMIETNEICGRRHLCYDSVWPLPASKKAVGGSEEQNQTIENSLLLASYDRAIVTFAFFSMSIAMSIASVIL